MLSFSSSDILRYLTPLAETQDVAPPLALSDATALRCCSWRPCAPACAPSPFRTRHGRGCW